MHITDALILRKDAVGEADVLVTALTPRLVKIRLLAQGARKVEAKLKGHLESFSLSRISFIAGRNGYRLVGAELLDFFPHLKSDFERLQIAHDIRRSLESALFEDQSEENPGFFFVAHEAFCALNTPPLSGKDTGAVLTWFRMRFLDVLGLLPDTDEQTGVAVHFGSLRAVSCRDFLNRSVPQYHRAVSELWRVHAAEFSAVVV